MNGGGVSAAQAAQEAFGNDAELATEMAAALAEVERLDLVGQRLDHAVRAGGDGGGRERLGDGAAAEAHRRGCGWVVRRAEDDKTLFLVVVDEVRGVVSMGVLGWAFSTTQPSILRVCLCCCCGWCLWCQAHWAPGAESPMAKLINHPRVVSSPSTVVLCVTATRTSHPRRCLTRRLVAAISWSHKCAVPPVPACRSVQPADVALPRARGQRDGVPGPGGER